MITNPYEERRRARQSAGTLTPEDEATLLGRIGGGMVSGLSWAGNALDVPLSMVRDTLTGNNPFDQLLHPFSHSERGLSVSDRELAEHLGMRRNKETGIKGWLDDPGEGLRDVGAFALGVGLDPLTYLTFGASALGKGGKVVKAAGAGKMNAIKRMKTTVKEAAEGLDVKHLDAAAQKAGFKNRHDFLEKHGNEAMGGLVGVGAPFRKPSFTLGKAAPPLSREPANVSGMFDFGKQVDLERHIKKQQAIIDDPKSTFDAARLAENKVKVLQRDLDNLAKTTGGPTPKAKPTLAERFAEHSDALGHKLRYGKLGDLKHLVPDKLLPEKLREMKKATGAPTKLGEFSPGQQIAKLLGWKEQGVNTPEISPIAQRGAEAQTRTRIDVRRKVAHDIQKLDALGLLTDEGSTIARKILEGVFNPEDYGHEGREMATKIHDIIGHWRGVMDANLQEAREWGVKVGDNSDPTLMEFVHRTASDMAERYSTLMGREAHAKGVFGGTEMLREIIRDPRILEGSFDDGYKYFLKTYAGEHIIRRTGGQELMKELVQRIRTTYTPGQREMGLYGRNFLQDIQDGTIGLRIKTDKARAGIEGIAKYAKPIEELSGPTVPVSRLIEDMGLNRGMDEPIFESVTRLKSGVKGPDPLRIMEMGETPTQAQLLASRMGGPFTQEARFGPPHQPIMPGQIQHLDVPERVLHSELTGGVEKNLNPNKEGALFRLRELLEERGGKKLASGHGDYETMFDISRLHVPEHIAKDLVRMMGNEPQKMAGPLMEIFDSYMNLFKVGVLTHPARFVRDRMSGAIHNMLTGNWSLRASKEIHGMLAGKAQDFTDIPIIQTLMDERKMAHTPENSTAVMQELFYTYEQFGGTQGAYGVGESAGMNLSGIVGRTADFRNEMIGKSPIDFKPTKWRSLRAGTTWKPHKIRGVMGELETQNKIVATGERISKGTDALNRGEAFITNLRRGASPDEAAQIVNGVQVNYAPHTFTDFERKTLKRIFPFYSFTSRMTKHVIEELAHRPGGGVAQAIRAQAEMTETDLPQPAYVGQAGAIPVETLDDGTKRYITSLGLMHEDPLSFLGGTGGIGGTLQTAGLELLSRTTPLPKALVELATGEQFFQRGLTGGRELGEADPPLGRLLTNLGLREEGIGGRATPVGGVAVEHLLANSPLSRVLSTGRTLTDPRKRAGDGEKPIPGLAALTSSLTGVRVTDVSPGAQDVAISQRADKLAKEHLGGRSFTTTYIPKELIQKTRQQNPELASQMDAFNQLNSVLDKRARKRRKDADAKKRMGLATGP